MSASTILSILEQKGSKRCNELEETLEQHPMLLLDKTVQRAFIRALGDRSHAIVEQAKKYLIRAGHPVIPLLLEGFDPLGKKEMLRRMEILSALGGESLNDWYLSTLSHKCKGEIRVKLIEALRYCKDNVDILLNLAEKERGGGKNAARSALYFMDAAKTDTYWKAQVAKDPASAEQYLITSTAEWLTELTAERLSSLLDSFLQGTGVIKEADAKLFFLWLSVAQGKRSETLKQFYQKAASCGASLSQLVQEDGCSPSWCLSGGSSNRDHLAMQIGVALANTLIWTQDAEYFQLALDNYKQWPNEVTARPALVAALLTKPAKQAFELFAPLIEKAKGLPGAAAKEERTALHTSGAYALASQFGNIEFYPEKGQHFIYFCRYDPGNTITKEESFLLALYETLDPRWLLFLMLPGKFDYEYFGIHRTDFVGNRRISFVIRGLANPKDENTCATLRAYFHSAYQHANDYEMYEILESLKMFGETRFRGMLVEKMQKRCWWDYTLYFHLEKYFTPQDAAEELLELSGLMRAGSVFNTNESYNDPATLEENAQRILESDGFDNLKF